MNFTKLALIEKGKKSYTCRICDYVKYASFPATGHSFADGVCSGCGFEAPDPDYVAPVIPGDVDGNGVLNIIDIARLYGNVKGSAQLEDTAAADFNGDGKINIIDVAQAYAQVKG